MDFLGSFHLWCLFALKLRGELLSPLLNTKHKQGHLVIRVQRPCWLLQRNRLDQSQQWMYEEKRIICCFCGFSH